MIPNSMPNYISNSVLWHETSKSSQPLPYHFSPQIDVTQSLHLTPDQKPLNTTHEAAGTIAQHIPPTPPHQHTAKVHRSAIKPLISSLCSRYGYFYTHTEKAAAKSH